MNRRSILKATAISGAAVLLICTTSTTASATQPGNNGRIVFSRIDENGLHQLWTANPDLSAAHQLSHLNANSGWPGWAPDASRIAFDSDRSDPDPTDTDFVNDVFTMRADGSDVRKLTDSVGFSGDPAYSPDGTSIAFDADRGIASGDPDFSALRVYVMRTDGSGTRAVTTPQVGSSDTEPRFSPDGQKLLFTRYRGGPNYDQPSRHARFTSAVFTVNLDGSGEQRVTGWGHMTGQADWSPDGSRIVYEAACCLTSGGIYSVRADGSGFTAIVNGHGITGVGNGNGTGSILNSLQWDGYYDPVWSPDGTKLIAGREFVDENGEYQRGLVVVDADGSNLHWLSTDFHEDHQPDWGTAPLE